MPDRSLCAEKQPDPFSHFDATQTRDGETDTGLAYAYVLHTYHRRLLTISGNEFIRRPKRLVTLLNL